MKKALILFVGLFLTSGLLCQEPQDAEPGAPVEQEAQTAPSAPAEATAPAPAPVPSADPLVVAKGEEFPSDVLGWQSLRWGMTMEEAQAAFPDAKPIHHRKVHQRKGEFYTHGIKDWLVGGAKYKVYFVCREGSPFRLTGVQLVFSAEFTAYKANYKEIQQAMTQKYGPPDARTDPENRASGQYVAIEKTTDWIFPTTVISLSETRGTGLIAPRTTVIIDYRQSDKKSGVASGL